MAALIKHRMYEGWYCRRINFDDFCCRLRSTMQPNSQETEYDLIDQLVQCDILFIDDLGLRQSPATDFAYITFYTILNKRQERGLQTCVSSNKPLGELKQSFDSRIISRLRSAKIIHLEGSDRRKGEDL